MFDLRISKLRASSDVSSQLTDPGQIQVFNAIAKHRSIPFLELLDVTDIDEQRLQSILAELEALNLVKVGGRGNVVDEFVTLSGAATMSAYR